MKKRCLTLIFLIGVFFLTATCSKNKKKTLKKEVSLLVYSGAGMQKPMDEISEKFSKKFGVKVFCDYAGSGYLYAKILSSKKGDLFMPGAFFYVKRLEDKGLIIKYANVAKHIPVIAVPKGNPKHIKSLFDLAKPGIKIALGDKNIAIGKTTVKILKKVEKFYPGITRKIMKNVVVTGASVKQVLLYVLENQVDAAIVWRADAIENKDKVDILPINSKYNVIKTIPIAILKYTQNKDMAEKFYNYVLTEGKKIFKKHGFVVIGE